MKGYALVAVVAALAACSQPAQQEAVPAARATDAALATAALATAAPAPSATQPSPTTTYAPAQPSTSLDPAKVVVAWATAMSLMQWDSAYRYWGEQGVRSGLTAAQFAAKWGKLVNPEFELHSGTTEGAAGSSYYTAPIVLIDGQRQVRGEIVLRRVNDVDGATPEQLRWHIERLTIAP